MASALFLYFGVTLWKTTCTEIATSPATSPVRRHEFLRQFELTLGPEAPKNWLWLQVPVLGIAPSCRWGHLQNFSPNLDPDCGKKKKRKKNSKSFPETRSQALVQGHGFTFSTDAPRKPGSVHTTPRGHRDPQSSSRWPARNLAFTSSSALLGLLCPQLALSKTCFCPPKTTEPDLGRTGEQRPAQERLSRATKFACPSF